MSTILGAVISVVYATIATTIQPATTTPDAEGFSLMVTRDLTGAVTTADLSCRPPNGHPDASQACAQLEHARGQIADIAPADGFCLQIFDPVTVRATGTWQGERRALEGTFSNGCLANLQTGGHLFNF